MALLALVVDDSMLARHTVSRFLEERGFKVESVCNGREALDRLATLDPDLIITDLQMPTMGGREFIQALKKNRSTAAIPVIIVAARENAHGGDQSGANYTIYKDIDVESQLTTVLAAIFGKSAASP
jgi:CheY-like chemotaxis protein